MGTTKSVRAADVPSAGAPDRSPWGGRSRRSRLLTYGGTAVVGAALCVLVFAFDTFMETGRGAMLYGLAPLVTVLYAVFFVRELRGRPPLTTPGRQRRS